MAQSHHLARNLRVPRRSVSFPSRLPSSQPPLHIVSELKTLGASLSVSPPPTAKTIESNLRKLAEIYIGVDEIVMSLTGKNVRDAVGGAVDDVVVLLDVCGHAMDVVSSTKQEVRDLQSVLRRKSRGRDVAEVEHHLRRFLLFRKDTRRAMWKHLESLKRLEWKNAVLGPASAVTEEEDYGHPAARARESLRELHGTTVTFLRSVLVSFTPPPRRSNERGWSVVVSRLVLPRDAWSDSVGFDEAEGVDSMVQSLRKKPVGEEEERRRRRTERALEEMMDGCILGLEQGLERLHRRLVKHRVCLLNLVNN